MPDPASHPIADCSCPMCRRAAALDAMRQIEAARAASRVPTVADDWHEPDPLGEVKGIGNALLLGGLFWLAVAILCAIAWAWAS
jgi:hypothetical protein